MSQDKFFKELEKRLEILSEEERNDIINEYKDTLHEKIKHGETEEKAIEDFGPMDELVKEILSAYKINPNYTKEGDKLKKASSDLGNSLNRFIKTCSESISQFLRQMNEEMKENGQEITVELITELVIKGIITLFILALATIPFNMIRSLGTGILESLFYPLSSVLNIIWIFLIGILYFCVAALIVIAMFKEYVPKRNNQEIKKEKKENSKEKNKKQTKQEKKEEQVIPVKKENKSSHGIANAIMILVRIWIVIFILIPLWCVIIGTSVCLALALYYTFQGLPIIGIDILGLGFLILFLYLTKIITDLTFKRKKIVFYPFIISIVCMAIGGIMTFDLFMNIDYHQTLPKDKFHETTEEYRVSNIQRDTNFYIYGQDFNVVEDQSLKDGEVVVVLSYYDEYVEPFYHTSDGDEYSYITFSTNTKEDYMKDLYHEVLDDFKKKEIYSYESLGRPTIVEIRANANTKGYVH